jgi:chemotaxis protein MotB
MNDTLRERTAPTRHAKFIQLPLVFMIFAIMISGCVSTGTFEQVRTERDKLYAENEELKGRYDLLKNRIELINNERLEQSLVVQIQAAVLQKSVKIIEQQEQQITRQASTIASQEEALKVISRTHNVLANVFGPQLGAGRIAMRVENGVLIIDLVSEILFDSGSVELNASGVDVVKKVAQGLGQIPYQVVVAGHTDNVAIGSALQAKYPSNWELAGARAASVIRAMKESGIPGRRLVAVSFGEYNPVATNETPEGRKKNRRIEFRIVPIISK